MSTTNRLLFQINSKFVVICKNAGFEYMIHVHDVGEGKNNRKRQKHSF